MRLNVGYFLFLNEVENMINNYEAKIIAACVRILALVLKFCDFIL